MSELAAVQPAPKDPERLYFPCEITEEIGMPVDAINALKRKGCPFYGRKTTIRWVRDFIAQQAAPIPTPEERAAELRAELERLAPLLRVAPAASPGRGRAAAGACRSGRR